MHASRLTFTPETQKSLNNPLLSAGKKRQLRIERIKEYIKSFPAGTKIKIVDIAAAAGYNTEDKKNRHAGCAFVRQLVKRNIITCDRKVKAHAGIWGIPEEAKTTANAPTGIQTADFTPADFISETEAKAKEFAWEENSNDLREFINWLKINA